MLTERSERIAHQTVPDPPCTSCALAQRCRTELLACKLFERYLMGRPWQHSPRVPMPSARRYRELFNSASESPPS